MTLLHRAAALAAFIVCATAACAEDLDVTLGRHGNIVKVEVQHEDKTPATGVKVALVGPDKMVIAEGKINADGEWSWPAPSPGTYEVVLDGGRLRYPIVVKAAAILAPQPDPDRPKCAYCAPAPSSNAADSSERQRLPWASWGIAVGGIAICGLGFWLAGRRTNAFPNTNA